MTVHRSIVILRSNILLEELKKKWWVGFVWRTTGKCTFRILSFTGAIIMEETEKMMGRICPSEYNS